MHLKYQFYILIHLGFFFLSCNEEEPVQIPLVKAVTSDSSSINSSRGVIFVESFEKPAPFSAVYNIEKGEWNYALKYVSNPVFSGSRAARFEVRKDEPLVKNGKRSEVTIIHGSQLPGRDMWYSYAIYFPENYRYDSKQEVLNQWYQDRTPATALRAEDDRIYLHTGNEYEPDNRVEFDLGPINKGIWNTFVFHIIHSHSPDGLVEVWRNGVKLLTRKGGNMYDVGIMPKFKLGVYKSAFKYGTSDVDRRIVYYDNIKVGNEIATLEEMDPGAGVKSSPTGPAPTALRVESFTLFDAKTGRDIMNLDNGATISLKKLGSSKLNIRANSSSSSVSAIKFVLNGAETTESFDEVTPYVLFGNDRKPNSWMPNLGHYTLRATSYSETENELGNNAGPVYKIEFKVIE